MFKDKRPFVNFLERFKELWSPKIKHCRQPVKYVIKKNDSEIEKSSLLKQYPKRSANPALFSKHTNSTLTSTKGIV